MKAHHIKPSDLQGKIIDCHSHVGVGMKAWACGEYPYAQSIEGMYYRQIAAGVDVNIVFPFGPDLYFDLQGLVEGRMEPAARPLSPAPYAAENLMLMREIFCICPEYQNRFIPFVSVDPGRMVAEQIAALEALEKEYPIYGIKISPVSCQTPITALLCEGQPFLEFARRRNLPFLLHTTVDPQETFSHARLAFEVIDAVEDVRFCLAHCAAFHRDFLDRAAAAANVWVDTAALAIQVLGTFQNHIAFAPESDRFPADYSDHVDVMRRLCAAYPKTIIWGTDSPYYTFIARRRQGESDDSFEEFRLKANYEDEKAALDALPPQVRTAAANTNTLRFLFG